jgi:hypothetical protein
LPGRFAFIIRFFFVYISIDYEKTYADFYKRYDLTDKDVGTYFISDNGVEYKESCMSPYIFGKASFKVNDRLGVIDIWGKVLIEPTYDWIKILPDGCYEIKTVGVWKVLDKNGKPFTAPSGKPLTINVDGKPVIFPGQQPVYKDGTYLVPALWAMRALSAVPHWYVPDSVLLVPFTEDLMFSMKIGTNYVSYLDSLLGDSWNKGDYPAVAQIINDCVMIPVEAFLDMSTVIVRSYTWDKETNVIDMNPGFKNSRVLSYDPSVPAAGGPCAAVLDEKNKVTGWISEPDAREKLLAMEKTIPQGTLWGDAQGGCNSFAAKIRANAFGGNKMSDNYGTIHQDLSAIRVGDWLHYGYWWYSHVVVVTKVLEDGVEVAEGNVVNAAGVGKVYWRNDGGTPHTIMFDDLYGASGEYSGFIFRPCTPRSSAPAPRCSTGTTRCC